VERGLPYPSNPLNPNHVLTAQRRVLEIASHETSHAH
jgi:hypothetical protein